MTALVGSRIARFLAAAALACALALAAASSAAATVTRDGNGFAIADDRYTNLPTDGTFEQTLKQLYGHSFRNIEPRAFRFQILWNAGDDPLRIERARRLVDYVRGTGVTQIVVTLRIEGTLPSATTYDTKIRSVISQLASRVDVWGPINEPPSDSAALVAQYWQKFNTAVSALDPTALKTSPDFLDRHDLASIQPYINTYKSNGGGFGNIIAWHPYWGVHNKTRSTTDDMLAAAPTGVPVWITEVGAFGRHAARGINDPPSVQGDRVNWLVNNANGLANHPRVTRIHYYHMNNEPLESWDSALIDGNWPRPAWWTWCAATHGGNVDPACTAGPFADRLGVRMSSGLCSVKEGTLSATWVDQWGSGCNEIELSAHRIGVRYNGGTCAVKEGTVEANWGLTVGCSDLELAGDRIGVRDGGNCKAKDGSLSEPFLDQFTGDCTEMSMAGDRIGVRNSTGSCWAKEGDLTASWVVMFTGDCREIEVTPNRIGVRNSTGSCWVKEGSLYADWIIQFSGDCTDLELTGNRIGVRNSTRSCWAKEGSLYANWDAVRGGDCNDLHLSGDRIGVQTPTDLCTAKDGALSANWMDQAWPTCTQIRLSKLG